MINAPNHKSNPQTLTSPNSGNQAPSNNKLRAQGRPRPAAAAEPAISAAQPGTCSAAVGLAPKALQGGTVHGERLTEGAPGGRSPALPPIPRWSRSQWAGYRTVNPRPGQERHGS